MWNQWLTSGEMVIPLSKDLTCLHFWFKQYFSQHYEVLTTFSITFSLSFCLFLITPSPYTFKQTLNKHQLPD